MINDENEELKLYIVCFMDLLGYKNLISQFKKNLTTIKVIEEALKDTFSRLDQAKNRDVKSKIAKANQIVAQRTKYRMISDSTIFTLPVTNFPKIDAELNDAENSYICILSFFLTISHFWLRIGFQIGHFYRGGIAVGYHYENILNEKGNVFMFSEALVDAASLNVREDPMRVVLGDSVRLHLAKISNNGQLDHILNARVFNDDDKNICLDTYSVLLSEPRTEKILNGLTKGIRLQIERNAGDDYVLKKYRWLRKYHNKHVRRLIKSNQERFLIDDF